MNFDANVAFTGFRHLMHTEGTMKEAIIAAVAEMMGTGILVFLGCMGCVGGLGMVPPHLQITLNFGLAVMIVIQVISFLSIMYKPVPGNPSNWIQSKLTFQLLFYCKDILAVYEETLFFFQSLS